MTIHMHKLWPFLLVGWVPTRNTFFFFSGVKKKRGDMGFGWWHTLFALVMTAIIFGGIHYHHHHHYHRNRHCPQRLVGHIKKCIFTITRIIRMTESSNMVHRSILKHNYWSKYYDYIFLSKFVNSKRNPKPSTNKISIFIQIRLDIRCT